MSGSLETFQNKAKNQLESNVQMMRNGLSKSVRITVGK